MSCPLPPAQLGAVGFAIELLLEDVDVTTGARTAVNLSGATTLEIVLQDPDGTSTTYTATAPTPANGIVRYVTQNASELSKAGTWRAQANVVLASGFAGRSESVEFEVAANL